jgi:hypothetical protein
MSTPSRRIVSHLIALVAIMFSVETRAQNEVVVTTLVKPPYSPYLSDYVGFDNKIVVTLLNRTNVAQSIRLAGQVKGSTGITVTIPNTFVPNLPIVLAPNQSKQLMGTQLKEYLNPDILQFSGISKQTVVQGNGLPEGDYSFCLQALDYATGKPRSQAAPSGCANFVITHYEPPTLISPACNATVTVKNPQSILFSWTAPAGVPPTKVEYLLKIAEIYPQNGSAAQAMAAATDPPFFEKIVPSTAFLYGATAPKLEPGKRYAVRVTARNKGMSKELNFKNNGHSVVCAFTYGEADMADEEPPADTSGNNDVDEEYADACTPLNCAPQPLPAAVASNRTFAPGDEIQIGYFTLRLVSLSSASAGNLSGEGTIDAPIFHTQLRATFQGLKVNPDNKVYSGVVTGAYDPGATVDQALRSFAGGLENVAAEKVKQLTDAVRANQKYIENFADVDAKGLPFAFNKVIDSKLNLVTIAAVEFAPDGARFNAFLEMPIPEANNKVLAFGQKNICFHPTGLSVGGLQKLTMLGGDYTFPWGEKVTVTLKKAQGNSEGTYVKWDCKGYREMRLDGVLTFKGTMLEKTEGAGEVKGTFALTATTWGDVLGEIKLDPFSIRGMKGLKLGFTTVVLDFSDTRNAQAMAFPAGYDGTTGSDWRGLYFKQITATLPKYLKNANKPVTITLANALIGKMGFTGSATVEPVFGLDNGSVGGWAFSMEKIEIGILNNTLAKGRFNGKLKLPIAKTEIGYSCLLGNSDAGLKTAFAVDNIGDIDVDMWGAKLTIADGSSISVESAGDDVTVKASLSGSLTVDRQFAELKGVSVKIPGVEFENLVVQNKKPYLSATLFKFASPQKSFAGFPVSINPEDGIQLKFAEDGTKAGLRLALHVGLDGNEQSAISGGTAFTLWGKMTEQNGRQSWSIATPTLESINIKASVASCDMEGKIDLYKGDPKFGDGFRGAIMVNFRPLVKLAATVQFGSTKYQSSDTYRYWYVDAMAVMGFGIPVFPGFGIYGFGGGAYHHMKPESAVPAAANLAGESGSNTKFKQDEAGQSNTGVVYTPDPKIAFGLKASIVMGTMPKPNAFNGDVTLEASFFNGGGLNEISLAGNGYFMQVPDPKKRPSKESALVYAGVGFKYSAAKKTFDGLLDVKINLKAGRTELLTGGGQASMHFSKDKWFVKLGEPNKRIGLKVLGLVDIGSYLMVGKNSLPGMPDLPSSPINFRKKLPGFNDENPRNYQAETGSGFAFGQQLSVNTGKLKFLIFYAQIAIAFGYDISILNVDQECAAANGKMGINGWYAQGQVYAGLEASVGLDINLWFLKTQIELFHVGVYAALKAGLPNPTWLKGQVAGEYSALNGLLKGHCTFKFKYGEKCDPAEGDPFGGLKVIAEMKPDGSDANVFSYPEAVYNLPIGETIAVEVLDGDDNVVIHRFRFGVKDFTVVNTKTKQNVAGSSELANKGFSTLFTPEEMFDEKTKYEMTVRIYGDRAVDGKWVRIGKKNNPDVEHLEIGEQSFTTGDAPETFVNSNIIATTPGRMQRYFHWGDNHTGVIRFNQYPSNIQEMKPEDDDFKYSYLARLQEIGAGSTVIGESPLEWDPAGKQVKFQMPQGIDPKKIYIVQIVRQKKPKSGKTPSGSNISTTTESKSIGDNQTIKVKQRRLDAINLGDNEFMVYQLAFKTSQYSGMKRKLDDYFQSDETITTGSGGNANTAFITFTGKEPLDWYDVNQTTYRKGSVTGFVNPLISARADNYLNGGAVNSLPFWFRVKEDYAEFVWDPWIKDKLELTPISYNPVKYGVNTNTQRKYPSAEAYPPGSRFTNGSSIADSVMPVWAVAVTSEGTGDDSRLTSDEINASYHKGLGLGDLKMGGGAPNTGGSSGGKQAPATINRMVVRYDAINVIARDRKIVYDEMMYRYGLNPSSFSQTPIFWTFIHYNAPVLFEGDQAGKKNQDYVETKLKPGADIDMYFFFPGSGTYGREVDLEIP